MSWYASAYFENNNYYYVGILDIDECQITPDICEHTCINTVGSYYCLCDYGFSLNITTNSTCDGKWNQFTKI